MRKDDELGQKKTERWKSCPNPPNGEEIEKNALNKWGVVFPNKGGLEQGNMGPLGSLPEKVRPTITKVWVSHKAKVW